MTPLAFCLKSQHRLWILHQGNIPLPWPLPWDYAAGVLPYSRSLNFITFNCGYLKPCPHNVSSQLGFTVHFTVPLVILSILKLEKWASTDLCLVTESERSSSVCYEESPSVYAFNIIFRNKTLKLSTKHKVNF